MDGEKHLIVKLFSNFSWKIGEKIKAQIKKKVLLIKKGRRLKCKLDGRVFGHARDGRALGLEAVVDVRRIVLDQFLLVVTNRQIQSSLLANRALLCVCSQPGNTKKKVKRKTEGMLN